MKTFKIDEQDQGVRADIFISRALTQYTRSSLSKLFELNNVTINDKPVKPSRKLVAGDKLNIDISPLTKKIKPQKIDILYEDKDMIVMDKPAGMLTHSKGSFNPEPTVADFLKTKIIDPNLSGNRAGIVHRLDRATSGVIIGAKNKPTQDYLQKQFAKRNVKKTYTAVVHGKPSDQKAVIDAPIARNAKRPQTFKVQPDGKPAQTEYEIIKTTNINGKTVSILRLKPKTGRTHQLRVHARYMGHPIVGDRLYSDDSADNMYLHASELELTLPNGTRAVFTSPEPKIFSEL
jgi:23S rRNA pseudouridine1911/1915/1917 synthase